MSERKPARRLGGRAVSSYAGLLIAGFMLVACGGGGGGDSGGGSPNVAPVADAGADRTVVELTAVQLSGSATDANTGDTLSFAWSQTGGPPVMLNNTNAAQADFDAPDVVSGAPAILTFRLTVTDSAGAADSDDVQITVQEPGAAVAISGTASYEFVPTEFVPAGGTCRLDYPATFDRPIRQATIQVLDESTSEVLGSATTGEDGSYSITVDANRSVFLRVRAELKRGGTPSWDVDIRDNTSTIASPLGQRPLYVLDTAAFDSGTVDQTRDVLATTGWNGTSYASTRAAAPFAILDTIYSAMLLVLTADSATAFPTLDAFWSVNNSPAQGAGDPEDNIDSGELGTSFYSSGINSLFLLGQADQDTEEFDDHVIVHEWGHYFEDVFSRSDSIGGPHGFGDRLDMRVAFGEGWATALSGMALDSPQYCDTQGTAQANGFDIDIESDTPNPRGWFNEFSVMALVYDLWDTDPDLGGADTDSIGFGPIFETMMTAQAGTAAHTSIFSFTDGLRSIAPGAVAFIDALRIEHNINGTGIYGDDETNDASTGTPDDVLPVYTVIQPNGTTLNICSNRQFDNGFDGNKLSEYRFLRMTIGTPSRFEFDIVTDDATVAQLPPDDPDDDRDQSDPDLLFRLNGQIQNAVVGGQPQGLSGDANQETFTTPNVLAAGDYVMDLVEFRHTDEDSDADFPEQSCFDMTVTPVP